LLPRAPHISSHLGSEERAVKWKAYGRYGSVGFELVVSMIVGYVFGKWLDEKVGGGGWLTGLFSVAGVYAGFRSLFKAAKEMQRDVEKQEKLDRGESPWKVKTHEIDYDAFDKASDEAEAREKEEALRAEAAEEEAKREAAEKEDP